MELKYQYKNKNYTRVEGLSSDEITKLLKDVHSSYEEYRNEPFIEMVMLFANDDFFKYHYVAKEYLVINQK